MVKGRWIAVLLAVVLIVDSVFIISTSSYGLKYDRGEVTISFDSSIPNMWRGYILELFNTVYPEIKVFYGQPARSLNVKVKYNPSKLEWFYFDSSSNTVYISRFPSSTLGDPRWDFTFTHELLHTFHADIMLVYRGHEYEYWAEEGMAEACAQLVAYSLHLKNLRNLTGYSFLDSVRRYDRYRFIDGQVVGGVVSPYYKGEPKVYYRVAAGMFLMLALASVRGFKNLADIDFFRRLNDRIYSYAEVHGYKVSYSVFLKIIDEVSNGALIDGLSFSEWVSRQPIVNVKGNDGMYMLAFVYDVNDPKLMYAFTFKRTNGREYPIEDVQVTFKIFNSYGLKVYESAAYTHGKTYTDEGTGVGEAVAPIDLDLNPGGYTVLAEALVNGERLKSISYFVKLPRGFNPNSVTPIVILNSTGYVSNSVAIRVLNETLCIGDGVVIVNASWGNVYIEDGKHLSPLTLSIYPRVPYIVASKPVETLTCDVFIDYPSRVSYLSSLTVSVQVRGCEPLSNIEVAILAVNSTGSVELGRSLTNQSGFTQIVVDRVALQPGNYTLMVNVGGRTVIKDMLVVLKVKPTVTVKPGIWSICFSGESLKITVSIPEALHVGKHVKILVNGELLIEGLTDLGGKWSTAIQLSRLGYNHVEVLVEETPFTLGTSAAIRVLVLPSIPSLLFTLIIVLTLSIAILILILAIVLILVNKKYLSLYLYTGWCLN